MDTFWGRNHSRAERYTLSPDGPAPSIFWGNQGTSAGPEPAYPFGEKGESPRCGRNRPHAINRPTYHAVSVHSAASAKWPCDTMALPPG
jgi:hypothetical protein